MLKFPEPSGPNKVGQSDCLWKEGEEEDSRKLVVRLFYPVDEEDFQNEGKSATWLPSTYDTGAITYAKAYAQAVLQQGMGSTLLGSLGFQPLMSSVRIGTKEDVPLSRKLTKFSPVIFSHGLAASRGCHSATCMDLASHGFFVVSLEHSDGSAAINILPDKTVRHFTHAPRKDEIPAKQKRIPRGFAPSISPENVKKPVTQYQFRHTQLQQRKKEMMFIADCLERINAGTAGSRIQLPDCLKDDLCGRLQLEHLSVVGHSFGACTGLSTCAIDNRFRVMVAHDVWLFPMGEEMSRAELRVPTLFLSADTFDNLWPTEGRKVTDGLVLRSRRAGVDACEGHVLGVRHQNFSDFPVLAPQITKVVGAAGPADPVQSMGVINRCTVDFLRHHLSLLSPLSSPSPVDGITSWLGRVLSSSLFTSVPDPWQLPEDLREHVSMMEVDDEETKRRAAEKVNVGLFTYDPKVVENFKLQSATGKGHPGLGRSVSMPLNSLDSESDVPACERIREALPLANLNTS